MLHFFKNLRNSRHFHRSRHKFHALADLAQQQREYFFQLLQAARIVLFEYDASTENLKWYGSLAEVYGPERSTENFNMGAWLDAIHPRDIENIQNNLKSLLGRLGAFDVEFRTIWRDGSIHWIAGKGISYIEPSSGNIQVLGISINITEKKAAEEALRDSEAHLQQLMEPFLR